MERAGIPQNSRLQLVWRLQLQLRRRQPARLLAIEAVSRRGAKAGSVFRSEWSARVSPKIHGSSSYGDCNSSFGGANPHGCSLSKPFLEEVRKLGLFSGMAEFAGSGPLTVSGKGAAHQASSQYVSGDYFQTLGVGAAAGRVFAPTDDAPGAAAVVVLHHGY